MVRGAATCRTIVQTAWALFNHVQKALEIGRSHFFRVHHQHLGDVGHQNQRHQITFQVVIKLGVHAWRDRVVNSTHEQVVTVRCGFGGDACAHCATCTSPVINDELLTRQFGKLG